jgi:hypothetical protein
MITRLMALVALTVVAAACTGPPPPKPVDAFEGLLNMNSAAVPTDVPVTLGQPAAFMTSDNVENYIGGIRDATQYWSKIVPASLTNTAVMADTDPTYFSNRMLTVLRRHFPTIQRVHDFPEAVQSGKRGVILVDLRMKWMEPYGDRTNRMHVDFYFFDTNMNAVSKISGEAEYRPPIGALEGHVQKITDEALQQIDAKMTALVH